MVERLLLRVAEGAESIGISRSKCYELIASGEIPSVRVGKSLRIPVEALREWAAKQVAASRDEKER